MIGECQLSKASIRFKRHPLCTLGLINYTASSIAMASLSKIFDFVLFKENALKLAVSQRPLIAITEVDEKCVV